MTNQQFPNLSTVLLGKPPVTMRSLLEREVAEQERYIEETLKAIGVPFHKSFHVKISQSQNTFSVKMELFFSVFDFEKVRDAFPLGTVKEKVSFVGGEISQRFVEISLPNQSTRFVYLSELLSSEIFRHSPMTLPIALGLDKDDLHLVDLAEQPHWVIKNDTPEYRYKVQQLVLLSLLYKHTPESLQIAWIDPKQPCPETIQRLIAPFAFTNASDPEELLKALVAERERRVGAPSEHLPLVVFINNAFSFYLEHAHTLNLFAQSQALGIYLIGSTHEIFNDPTVTVIQAADFHSLFFTSLSLDEEGYLHYERTPILLPFFKDNTLTNIADYRDGKLKLPEEPQISFLMKIKEHLYSYSKVIQRRVSHSPLSFKEVKQILADRLRSVLLQSTNGEKVLPLTVLNYLFHKAEKGHFNEMLERIVEKAVYYSGETPKPLKEMGFLQVLEANGQVLIEQDEVYTHTHRGTLMPFIIGKGTETEVALALAPSMPLCPVLDTLPNPTYPQLSLLVSLLQETALIIDLGNINYRTIHLLQGEAFAALSPIALIGEIETILLEVPFELTDARYLPHKGQNFQPFREIKT